MRRRPKTLAFTLIPLIAATATVATLIARRLFNRKLDALERHLDDSQAASRARTDLPPQIVALAARLGARSDHPTRIIAFRQTGTMWFKPGGHPRGFTAKQKIGATASGFVWRAEIGPAGFLTVVDSFVQGRGYLEARLFGALRVARIDGTAAINEGEALRYLAELPLNPDAILFDPTLEWSTDDSDTIKVAKGQGASRSEISFQLGEAGTIATMRAESRSFDASGKRYPWHGRFWDYQECGGRQIPMKAEVAWIIDGEDFVYWRGTMTKWAAHTTPSARA